MEDKKDTNTEDKEEEENDEYTGEGGGDRQE